MSYILEALKKSQAERELGRVPTLDTSVIFEEDKAEPKRGPWVPVAVGLAAAAMLLALYATLRGPGAQTPGGAPIPAGLPGPEAGSLLMPVPGPSARIAGSADDQAGPLPPATNASAPVFVRGANHPGVQLGAAVPSPVAVSIPPAVEPPSGAPLVEAPPPKGAVRPPVPVPVPAATEPAGGGADEGYPKTEAELDAELERELERQLAMESDPVPLVEPEEPPEPAPTPVPRELIAEIEAFKDQVRRGPGKAQASAKPSGTAKVQDPTALRLTAAQQAELPPFLMTVHVYVPDKTRRFVMINGLKYGEGEKTREDLTVEQILPNGAVLGFQGNPFYVHR